MQPKLQYKHTLGGYGFSYDLWTYIIIFISLWESCKWDKSEEKVDCHHQDSNQGPSLMTSDALPLSYGVVVIQATPVR